MKKFLAILLAALLVLVNVAALAESDIPEVPDADPIISGGAGQQAGSDTPHFVKKYESTADVVPTETLTFTIEASDKNPDNTMITLVSADNTDNEVEVSEGETTVNVIVPTPSTTAFTAPGKYTYTVTEVEGSTQGVTYDTTPITVDVYVIYVDGAITVLGTNVYTEITDDGKTDEIKNEYEVTTDDEDVGLKVSKVIDGNLADANMEFTFQVDFAAESGKTVNSVVTFEGNGTVVDASDAELENIALGWTATTVYVKLKGGDSLTFKNLPKGVSYTVVETKAGDENISRISDDNDVQITNANTPNAYTVTGDESGEGATGSIASKDDKKEVEITNFKGVEIPTGIALDTVPYVLIMVIALIGLAVAARKREQY